MQHNLLHRLVRPPGLLGLFRRCGPASIQQRRWSAAAIPRRQPSSTDNLELAGKQYVKDHMFNVPPSLVAKIDKRLHKQPGHPLAILTNLVSKQFPDFDRYTDLSPVVTTDANFDSLLIAADHPSRAKSDTFYVNKETVLRTHTSAHQAELLRQGIDKFLVFADVYRRDEIDHCHYPIFHQLEGLCAFDTATAEQDINKRLATLQTASVNTASNINTEAPPAVSAKNPRQSVHSPSVSDALGRDLQASINSVIAAIFGADKELKVRWVDAYFPFTSPSWEVEVFYRGKWLELCGCGITRQELLNNAGRKDKVAWAFGLGLERLAMVLFGIPDIRLFWSTDERFVSQFRPFYEAIGTTLSQPLPPIPQFQAISHFPPCTKDVSFWLPKGSGEDDMTKLHPNDVFQIVREVAGDVVESSERIDRFVNKKIGRVSECYRIVYRSMDKTLSNEEINTIQGSVRTELRDRLGLELR